MLPLHRMLGPMGRSYRSAPPTIWDSASHLWLMSERSGARVDSNGAWDLSPAGTGSSYALLGPSGNVTRSQVTALSAYLRWDGTTPDTYTIFGWVYNPIPSSYGSVVGVKGGLKGQINAGFNFFGAGESYVAGHLYDGSGWYGSAPGWQGIPAPANNQQQGWMFLAISLNSATKELKLYRDGVLHGTASYPGTAGNYPGTDGYTFGFSSFNQTGMGGTWEPQLARWGVTSAVLVEADLVALMRGGKGASYADLTPAELAPLLSFWNMTETSGTRYDSHGSSHLSTVNDVVGGAVNTYPANIPGTLAQVTSDSWLEHVNSDPGLSAGYTQLIWMRAYSKPSGDYVAQHVMTRDTGGDNKHQIRVSPVVYDSGSLVYISASCGRNPASAVLDAHTYYNGLIPAANWLGVWHQFIVTYNPADPTQMLRLWVDGVQASAAGTPLWSLPATLQDGGTMYFNHTLEGPSTGHSKVISVAAIWDSPLDASLVPALWNGGDGAALP